VADFSAATTIQDLINEVDRLNLGLRLGISSDGTGLNLVSEVSGIDLSVGENAGGTTATDLGLRSFGLSTLLSDFRFGLGIETQQGSDDLAFELHDGRTFNVNLDGLATVGQVITTINTAAAGLTVGAPGSGGTDFNLGLATDGNGFLFEDNTAGPGDFRVTQLNASLAATHLGINKNSGAGGSLLGDDEAQVRVESVFTHLIKLRDTLVSGNSSGITLAGEAIERDVESVALARAEVGVRSQRAEQQQQRSAELKTTEQSMLSELQDTDFTEVITRFVQLQQQLQAALQIGSQNLQLSFLDFLR
jgi:flagellin-like hook-associated protein FlgL